MKKTFILVLLVLVAVSGLVFLPARAEDEEDDKNEKELSGQVEKISSPDQIRYFKMIKKEDGSLFGVRIDKPVKGTSTREKMATSTDKMIASSTSNRLEKIAAPALINLYEKIQKIGSSLWGIRKKNNDDRATSTYRIIGSEISACVSAAIEKKDSALKEKIDLANTELKVAIDARTTCQKTAIASTEKQSDNIKACVKTFQSSHETIVKKAKEAQKSAWSTYQADLKLCLASSTSTAPIIVEDGGSNMSEILAQ